MNTEDKIQRFAVDPNKAASYKARKFLGILQGNGPVAKGITYRELNRLVKTYSEAHIQRAREEFKGLRRPSKYQVVLMRELGVGPQMEHFNRRMATEHIAELKEQKPEAYKAARKKLRGFSYE
jgi:hypothetical protein